MAGETVALVGESGSGKTVRRSPSCACSPYPAASHPGGEIYFKGEDLLKIRRQKVAPVSRQCHFDDFSRTHELAQSLHMIERQIGEVLEMHRGMSGQAARARVLDLLHKVGIKDPEQRLESYPHQLSGGQRQRVMIAMGSGQRTRFADR